MTRRMARNLGFFALAAMILSACATVKPVDPAVVTDVGHGIGVSSQVQWAKVDVGSMDPFWTIDGVGLGELSFHTGVKPGEPMMKIVNVREKDLPAFKADMLPDEVMNLVVSTLGYRYRQVDASGLRPVPFGSTTGFRFDLTCTTPSGLEMKGAALAAQRGGQLDVLLFAAPALTYFDRTMPTVEKIFASIRAE